MPPLIVIAIDESKSKQIVLFEFDKFGLKPPKLRTNRSIILVFGSCKCKKLSITTVENTTSETNLWTA